MDLQIDLVTGSPLRHQLEEALRDAIRSGRLLPGSLLPPTRRPGAPEPRHLTPFRYDLRPGQADFHAFPRRRWQAAVGRALRDLPDTRLTYGPHRGAPELRIAVAAYLRRARAVVVEPDQVVHSCGVSHGLLAVLAASPSSPAAR